MKFTELLVAFGIISLVCVSASGFINYMEEMRLKSAAFRVYSMFIEARNIALRNNCYCGVVIEEKDNGHYLTVVKDCNFNGVIFKDYISGRDKEVSRGFLIEKEYPGVILKGIAFSSKHVISFSPDMKSSSGSLYLSTKNPEDGLFKLTLYGSSFVVKPVKIFADGSKVKYE